MTKITITCAAFIASALAGCVASPSDDASEGAASDGVAIGETELAISTCGTKPTNPCFTWQCQGDSWEATGTHPGAKCQTTGTCNANGACVMPPPPPPITTPAISGIYMYSPTQTSFYQTCATGTTPTTTTLTVSINGGPAQVLPNTCASFGSGQRYDSYNIAPGQNRCYAIFASNASGTVNGVSHCFTTSDDLVTPRAPSGSARPGFLSADIGITDLSVNETQLRVYGRRANAGEAWRLLCTFERYNDNHQIGFPHAGTGDSYECGMNNLLAGVDYEAMLEAFHDHAPLSGTTTLPPFQVWNPNEVHIEQATPNATQIFVDAVATAGKTVVLERNANIDLTGRVVYFADDVTVTASPSAIRTPLNPGPRVYTTGHAPYFMSISCGGSSANRVKLQGFRVEGADYETMDGDDHKEQGITIDGCVGVDIGNMEISGFSGVAVQVVDRTTPRHQTSPADVHVHDSFIHNNQHTGGEGYGVATSDGGQVTIERNVFDFNRHSLMSTGSPTASYTALQNLILQGGGVHDRWYNNYTHVIDVHGTDSCGLFGDLNCGTAGKHFEIHGNAVQYWSDNAVKIRGTPIEIASITDNVFVQGDLGDAIAETQGLDHIYNWPNQLGVQTFGDYGVCDFDGDGRDDLFLATGVNWWYMSAGQTYWSYLAPNTERLSQVGLGDFNHDGRCDVFAINASTGKWQIASGGSAAWTNMPGDYGGVPLAQLRFGDFNGDHVKDIFYDDPNGQWWAVSPGYYGWTALNSSGFDIRALRLGDFNGDGITDILSRTGGHWAASWSGTSGWQATGAPQNDAFDNASIFIADVDDVPGDDALIYYPIDRTHGEWWISSNARTAWTRWVSYTFADVGGLGTDPPAGTPDPSLSARTFFGHFEIPTRSEALLVTGMVVTGSSQAPSIAEVARRSHIVGAGTTAFRDYGLHSY